MGKISKKATRYLRKLLLLGATAGGEALRQMPPPSGKEKKRPERKRKSDAEWDDRIGESDDDVMATGRDRGLGKPKPVPVHAHQARQQWLGPDPRTTIRARGQGIRFDEAGSMTAPRPPSRQSVEKVLAKRTPSIDAQV